MTTDANVEADAIFREVIEPLIESSRTRGYEDGWKAAHDRYCPMGETCRLHPQHRRPVHRI